MKRLIVKVKDKTKVHSLKAYGDILYVSKFLNVIGIEIQEANLWKLESDENIISIRESEEGKFQPNVVGCC